MELFHPLRDVFLVSPEFLAAQVFFYFFGGCLTVLFHQLVCCFKRCILCGHRVVCGNCCCVHSYLVFGFYWFLFIFLIFIYFLISTKYLIVLCASLYTMNSLLRRS